MRDLGYEWEHIQARAGHESLAMTADLYHGDPKIDRLSAAALQVSAPQADVKALQQAVNAEAGIMHVTGIHSDGRLDLEGLHPDWTPDGPQPDADVIQLPVT